MDKFWKWMHEMSYCNITNTIDVSRPCEKIGRVVEFNKQMLIGYMIEYLMTKHSDDDFCDLMDMCGWDLRNIENVYLFLKREMDNV